ncbi:DUF488 domain-containing protein [Phenylobacterium sp.]|uniref:DUF488 domain-containing protein n=1 Tax=Phenylobacterium sp. TaxID=1871053 RepID=UPI00198E3556|nr:DUF488 domain-containing protein [Phenylobacterium sp.]MBC7168989.1 DUF488 domain-containing protein [Phenylobacterium sp.]
MPAAVATIGYEAKTQGEMIAQLKAAGVETVVDVRAVAASRRPGFSKTILAASLEAEGIGYEHLRGLGTPKAGREAARAGRTAEMREIFEAHLAEPAAQVQLARAMELARGRKIALLCYEAAACDCHRAIVAERVCEALDLPVEDL